MFDISSKTIKCILLVIAVSCSLAAVVLDDILICIFCQAAVVTCSYLLGCVESQSF
jgi:hypothetical protein